jgi:hypothetical protein
MPPELKGDLEIQQLMLTSHTRWQRLRAVYHVSQLEQAGGNSPAEAQVVEVWVELPAKFKVVSSTTALVQGMTTVSDGESVLNNNGDRSALPLAELESFDPPNTPSDTVYLHPLAGFMGSPVSDLIFPAGLAQRGGEYKITGQEVLAGRTAFVVEWGREPGVLIDRFWVDRQTGVILRQQNYGKNQSITPVMDLQANYIEIDRALPPDTFDLAAVPTPPPTPEPPEPGTATITVKPEAEAINVRSGPGTDYKIAATLNTGDSLPVTGKTASGDWWRVDLTGGRAAGCSPAWWILTATWRLCR